MKIQIIFHSMSGHVYKVAESIAAGAREVYETGVALYQVPELIPQETLVATGAQASRSAFSHIPVATQEQMVEADAIICGTPTRFGMMSAQMRSFLDHTDPMILWLNGCTQLLSRLYNSGHRKYQEGVGALHVSTLLSPTQCAASADGRAKHLYCR